MKELEKQVKDEVVLVADQEKKKEIKLLGRQRKIKGHTLYEFNTVTRTLTKARFQKQRVELDYLSKNAEEIVFRSTVIVNDNCKYFQSLNVVNAIKKLKKEGFNDIIPVKDGQA